MRVHYGLTTLFLAFNFFEHYGSTYITFLNELFLKELYIILNDNPIVFRYVELIP